MNVIMKKIFVDMFNIFKYRIRVIIKEQYNIVVVGSGTLTHLKVFYISL